MTMNDIPQAPTLGVTLTRSVPHSPRLTRWRPIRRPCRYRPQNPSRCCVAPARRSCELKSEVSNSTVGVRTGRDHHCLDSAMPA